MIVGFEQVGLEVEAKWKLAFDNETFSEDHEINL